MCSPEELSTAEANDAAVVNGVLLSRLGRLLADEADSEVHWQLRVLRGWVRSSEDKISMASGLN